MSDKRTKSIPSWQREDASSPSSGTERDVKDHTAPSDTSRASVIEKVTGPVQEDGMQDVPIEREIALLKSKGSSDSKNDELEGVSWTVKDSSATADNTQVNDFFVMRKNGLLVPIPCIMLTPCPFLS